MTQLSEIEVKRRVRERDGHRCTGCGLTGEDHLLEFGVRLHVHRLRPGSIYTVEGCTTLCIPCHRADGRRRDAWPDDDGCPLTPANKVTLTFEDGQLARLKYAARGLALSVASYIRMAAITRMNVDGIPEDPPSLD